MALTLNYSKVLNYVYKTFIAIMLGTILIYGILFLPPLGDKSGDDGSANYTAIKGQLELLVDLERKTMGQVSDLRGKLEAGNELIRDLRSKLEAEFDNNLQSGDILIEAGINVDESLRLLGELERRLR